MTDIWNKLAKQKKEQELFRKLTIEEQLEKLRKSTEQCNCIIGKIYLKEKVLSLNDREQNIKELSDLLNNAVCVKDYGIMGQGDVEYRWIFSKDDLLIGISGISFGGDPISVINGCKVYRSDQQQTGKDLTDDTVEKLWGEHS